MEEYFKHYKGGIYRKLYIAKHSETQEQMVVYQAMYGNCEIWVRPKDMFYEEITYNSKTIKRFTKISKEEALKKTTQTSSKYNFPNIEYNNVLVKICYDADPFLASTQAMITLLTRRNIVPISFYDNFRNDNDIEQEIWNRILAYKNDENVEEIFHLIQTWGGRTGRGIYILEKYNWDTIKPHYIKLINICLNTTSTNYEALETLSLAVGEANNNIKHLGVSFITKHTRFWLYRTLGNNSLPIYDSIMAKTVMNKSRAELKHLVEYWKAMILKSKELNIDLMPLERHIFKFVFNNSKV